MVTITLDENHSASPVPPSNESETEEGGEKAAIYSVANSDIFGRYLVAKRTIRPGEMIICEKPIVIGPSSETDCSCLGCYIPLSPSDDNFKGLGCGWLLCDSDCTGLKSKHGHSAEECCSAVAEQRRYSIAAILPSNEQRSTSDYC